MKNSFSWRHAICVFGLIGLIILPSTGANLSTVSAHPPVPTGWESYLAQCGQECSPLLNQLAAPEGKTLIVTNTNEELNGDLSSPAALIANPGPDGISLREAIIAAEASAEFDVIRFHETLKGAQISTLESVPPIEVGNLLIDGDVDSDGSPDITLDGTNSARDTCFQVYGGSNVFIRGFIVRNFTNNAVAISPDPAKGKPVVSGIIVYQNDLSSTLNNAVDMTMWQMDHTAIRNVEIVENNLHDSRAGVVVHAGMGDGASNNEVEGIKIISNIINNPGYNIGVFISPASSNGISNNAIRNVEIRGNHMSNHENTTILIDASNQTNCNNNIAENILIADNWLDGLDVTIEALSESGKYSYGNQLSNITITGNVISTGGIQFSGATGEGAHDNVISNVLIERNLIHDCMANGIYLTAGTGGAYQNTLENVILRSNVMYDNNDAGILVRGDYYTSPNNTINDVTITNQTLVNNGNSWAGGINIDTKDASNTITGISFTNSILWGNAGSDAIRGSLVPDLVVANNILNDTRFTGAYSNFYQDPLFADPAAYNYQLQASSPGVDSGDPLGASIGALDLDARLRLWDGDSNGIAVLDRGAYEFGAIKMQEMNVRANGVTILDGDALPAPWDGTDFGAAELDASPVEQIFTIENTGEAALNLTGNPVVAIGGTHAGEFTVLAQPASQVAAGGFVSFTIEFTPQAVGLRQAMVSIASDDTDENPYTFAIQGTGTAPEIDIRGNNVPIANGDNSPGTEDGTDFSSVLIGGSTVQHTFTIHNTGTAALNLTGNPVVSIGGTHAGDFTVLAQPAAQVTAGGFVSFTIEFTPQGAGLRQAVVSIGNDDADENPYTFAIQGTGTAPEIDVRGNNVPIPNGDNTPDTEDGTEFGEVLITGGTVQHTFTIHNTGNARLFLTGEPIVAIQAEQSGEFAVLTQPEGYIDAGGSVSFTIRFTPQAVGLRQASVSIASDDADENPYTFTIQGTGMAPEIDVRGNNVSIPDSDDSPGIEDGTEFGEVLVTGGTVQHTFTIHNTGNAVLNLGSVAISGEYASEFTVLAQPAAQVAAGGFVSFTIRFTPQGAGLRQAVVSIANDDADENPYTFTIQGTGTAPEIDVRGNGVSIPDGDDSPGIEDGTEFGEVLVTGGTVQHTFTIHNTGTAALNLTGNPVVSIGGTHAGDFTVLAQPAAQVTAGGFVSFTIEFTPQAIGLRQAVVSIVNDDADENPYTFTIQGTGTAPEIDIRGNNVPIASDDNTPGTEDGTDFGTAELDAGSVEHTFTIHNTGNARLFLTGEPIVAIQAEQSGDFAVLEQPEGYIDAGGSVSFTIRFTPQAAGLRQAIVSIGNDDADENPYTFAIQGTGTAPEIDVRGNNVPIANGDNTPRTEDGTEFGSASTEGGMVQHIFTIHNTGNAALYLTGNPIVAISGEHAGEFAVLEQPEGYIDAGGSVSFTIRFTPQAVGLRQAVVSIASDDVDENPYTFTIQGTGTAPEIDVRGNNVSIANGDNSPRTEDGTEFGEVLVTGGTVQHTFTIHNTGNAVLNLGSVAISGEHAGDFAVLQQPAGYIDAGGSVSFTIRFTPQAAGLRQAIVSIGNDDADENPYTFAIQGTGTAPEIDVRGNNVPIANGDNTPRTEDGTEFGSASTEGGMVQHIFTIHNTGNAALYLTGNPIVAISGEHAGEFAVLEQPEGYIDAGGSVSFTIRFTPQAVGLRQAVVSIASDDVDENPYTFTIQGTSTLPVRAFLPLLLQPEP
ncbi:MAG: choice-of-anchor D domain-containing protein [Anaerolineaceae bacterium]|jgi:hypothetical protein